MGGLDLCVALTFSSALRGRGAYGTDPGEG